MTETDTDPYYYADAAEKKAIKALDKFETKLKKLIRLTDIQAIVFEVDVYLGAHGVNVREDHHGWGVFVPLTLERPPGWDGSHICLKRSVAYRAALRYVNLST